MSVESAAPCNTPTAHPSSCASGTSAHAVLGASNPVPVSESPTASGTEPHTNHGGDVLQEHSEQSISSPCADVSGQKPPRRRFSSDELIQLTRRTVDVNPFNAPHKQKTQKWKEILEWLQDRGMCVGMVHDTIRTKVLDMIEWHQNPGTRKGATLEHELPDSVKTVLAALLDTLSEQRRLAKEQTEAQKEKARKKEEEDRRGGEAIRAASLTAHRKRKQVSTESPLEVTDVSDAENSAPGTPRKKKKVIRSLHKSTSLSALDIEAGNAEFFRRMLEHMERSDKLHAEFQQKILEELKESRKAVVEVYERVGMAMLSMVRELCEAEKGMEKKSQ